MTFLMMLGNDDQTAYETDRMTLAVRIVSVYQCYRSVKYVCTILFYFTRNKSKRRHRHAVEAHAAEKARPLRQKNPASSNGGHMSPCGGRRPLCLFCFSFLPFLPFSLGRLVKSSDLMFQNPGRPISHGILLLLSFFVFSLLKRQRYFV